MSATECSKSALYISISWFGGHSKKQTCKASCKGYITYIAVCLGETSMDRTWTEQRFEFVTNLGGTRQMYKKAILIYKECGFAILLETYALVHLDPGRRRGESKKKKSPHLTPLRQSSRHAILCVGFHLYRLPASGFREPNCYPKQFAIGRPACKRAQRVSFLRILGAQNNTNSLITVTEWYN